MLGGVVLFVGLFFASTISTIWQFYFWIGIVSAAGIALIGMVPHVAIITREYPQRRGTALGIAWAGGGVGIVLLVPVTQLMIDKWDWSMAYIGLAVMTVLLVIPPCSFFCRRRARPSPPKPRRALLRRIKAHRQKPIGPSKERSRIRLFGCCLSRGCWRAWATR
jgi:MFS family permease